MSPNPFVLAAGFGNRLRPLTDVLPKPAVPVMGRPMVGSALARLASAGHRRVVINAHHLADGLRQEVDRWRDRGMPRLEIAYSVEQPDILGTGGGLVAARPLLGEGTSALVNGDILCDFDLPALQGAHVGWGASATLLLIEHPDVERFGAIEVDAEGRVVNLANLARRSGDVAGEAGPPVRRGVFAGVHLVEPAVFDLLPTEGHACIVRQGYVPMMQAGMDVRAVFHEGTWNDLGTIERYLETHADLAGMPFAEMEALLEGQHGIVFGLDGEGNEYGDRSAAEIHATAELRHPVALGRGCVIGEGAIVGPGTVLGEGVTVGRGAQLRSVVAWDGTTIEAGARLDRAVAYMDGGESRLAIGK